MKEEVVLKQISPCLLRRQPFENTPNWELMLRHPSLSYEAIRGSLVVLKTARLSNDECLTDI